MAQTTLTALFATYDQARQAVHSLEESGIPSDEITPLANNIDDAISATGAGAGIGAIGGGTLGLLTGLGLMVIPGSARLWRRVGSQSRLPGPQLAEPWAAAGGLARSQQCRRQRGGSAPLLRRRAAWRRRRWSRLHGRRPRLGQSDSRSSPSARYRGAPSGLRERRLEELRSQCRTLDAGADPGRARAEFSINRRQLSPSMTCASFRPSRSLWRTAKF